MMSMNVNAKQDRHLKICLAPPAAQNTRDRRLDPERWLQVKIERDYGMKSVEKKSCAL